MHLVEVGVVMVVQAVLLLLLHDVPRNLPVVALDVPQRVLRVDGAAVGRVRVVGGVLPVGEGVRGRGGRGGRPEEAVRLQVVVAEVLSIGGVGALVLDAAVVGGGGVGRRLLPGAAAGGAVDDGRPAALPLGLERLGLGAAAAAAADEGEGDGEREDDDHDDDGDEPRLAGEGRGRGGGRVRPHVDDERLGVGAAHELVGLQAEAHAQVAHGLHHRLLEEGLAKRERQNSRHVSLAST